LAAALHHARRDDLRRAVLLAGYALSAPKTNPSPACLQLLLHAQKQVRDRALMVQSTATVEDWRREGELLTEAQAAAIAFDGVPLDVLS
jgi:hypothetical protein